jgi:putative cell wall-binding protein
VETALGTYTTGGVTRISGADRYATAANLSAATFPANVNTVFVATGQNFPDALSGGPAVANTPSGGGPLLLVLTNSIPQSTATELARLKAQKIVVLGGTAAVADSVVTALDPYSVDPVVRRFGADRYFTSVEVSKGTFASSSKVYLATGANFPDALAGGSPAGIAHSPVLLTTATCIPPAVNDEINRLGASQVLVLGGSSAVSDAVLSGTVCQPPATTTTPSFDTGQFCNGGTFMGGFPCTVPSSSSIPGVP